MVGTEFSKIIDLKIDKAYSSFLISSEKNRLIKEATIKVINSKSADLDSNKDQLSNFIKTNQVAIPVNNQLSLVSSVSPFIADYMHYMAIKAKFLQPLNLTISSVTNASPIVITVNSNNLRTGEWINISGIAGTFAANGDFYIKKIKDTSFALYSDSSLTTAVSGDGVYSGGGSISRIFYEYCTDTTSDTKIDPYADATYRYPQVEVANNYLKIYPLTQRCYEATIDYLAKPSVFIDITDNTIDIEQTYPLQLLYALADESTNLFAQAFKDGELFQTSGFEIQKNDQ